MGPVIDYIFRDGQLDQLTIYSRGETQRLAEPRPAAIAEPVPTTPSFGLKEIIRSIDIAQDENIRGPMQGIFILIGGPGVGKTTVALHRIPYLIVEHGQIAKQAKQPVFFTQESTLVVVWMEHLVPYLKACLDQLEFDKVMVRHVEDWIASSLRPYVALGTGADSYRKGEELDDVAQAKLALTENDIESFLNSPANELAEESYNRVCDRIEAIRESLGGAGIVFSTVIGRSDYRFTVPGLQSIVDRLRDAFSRLDDAIKDQKGRSALSKARDQVTDLRTKELVQIGSSYIKLLQTFYHSPKIQEKIRMLFDLNRLVEFQAEVDKQRSARLISKVDRYYLMWIILFLTRGSQSEQKKCQPLPEYSHVLIDKAQYYHPVVLRLFARLTKSPHNSMTIVGDLEQKMTSKGGLVSWTDVGLDIPLDNIRRLVTDYRWSKNVFAFISVFKAAAALTVSLQEPPEWPSGQGTRAVVAGMKSRVGELDFLIQRLTAPKGGRKQGAVDRGGSGPESTH